MLSLLVAALIHNHVPKYFRELELAKIVAYHEAKQLHEEWRITIKDDKNPEQVVERFTYSEGDRNHSWMAINGEKVMEQGCDGTTSWMIMHPAKAYGSGPEKIDEPFKPEDQLLKTPEKDNFQFQFNLMRPVQFAHDPEFTLDSLEKVRDGDDEVWKATSSFVNKKGTAVKLFQWFEGDRWLLTRFEITGDTDDGPMSFKGAATRLEHHCHRPDTEYQLDQAAIAGFTRMQEQSGP